MKKLICVFAFAAAAAFAQCQGVWDVPCCNNAEAWCNFVTGNNGGGADTDWSACMKWFNCLSVEQQASVMPPAQEKKLLAKLAVLRENLNDVQKAALDRAILGARQRANGGQQHAVLQGGNGLVRGEMCQQPRAGVPSKLPAAGGKPLQQPKPAGDGGTARTAVATRSDE